MADRRIIDRIRKCLRLAKSANEHEAATALETARRLMDEHRLTSDDIDLAEVEEVAIRASRTQRPPLWEALLCRSVERAIGVSSYLNCDADRQFVGVGASAEIAGYAFQVLYRQLKCQRAAYIAGKLKRCGPASKRRRADAFCEGWAAAVYVKIREIAPDERDRRIDRYMAERHPDVVKLTPRAAAMKGQAAKNDYWNGVEGGHNVNLNRGMGTAVAPLQLA